MFDGFFYIMLGICLAPFAFIALDIYINGGK